MKNDDKVESNKMNVEMSDEAMAMMAEDKLAN